MSTIRGPDSVFIVKAKACWALKLVGRKEKPIVPIMEIQGWLGIH